MEVAVVTTGTANTASVLAWLARAGVAARLVTEAREVELAAALVLPGVGAFGAAMAHLAAIGLVAPLRERLLARRPTLGICLGMQLLFESSEESPGIAGLGIVPGAVRRLPPIARVPHMGWNTVSPPLPLGEEMVAAPAAAEVRGRRVACTGIPPGLAYFANSYAALEHPDGWRTATTTHTIPFIAAISSGPVLACQFHPELSSAYGRTLLDLWLARASAA
jgi:imidazoleglycerol phosphate synthase glutamine amidotransferase subunit HisH